MKLERVDCYGMEMWIVTGEPLPPPQRGTHCWHPKYWETLLNEDVARNVDRETHAYDWSRGEL